MKVPKCVQWHRQANACSLIVGRFRFARVGGVGFVTLCDRGLCWIGWRVGFYHNEAPRHG